MLRSLTILATVFALILGSLGLPVYMHACEMSAKSEVIAATDCPVCKPKPSCPVCAQKEEGDKQTITNDSGMKISATPCCAERQVVQHTDPTVLSKLPTVPTPLVIALAVFHGLVVGQLEITYQAQSWYDRPPPLATRAQTTYLFNSTFLI